ncbi:MAG: hypothetical protein ACK5Z5_00950 [Neisseriaceae bacterium]
METNIIYGAFIKNDGKDKFKITQNSYFRNYHKTNPDSLKIKHNILCIALKNKHHIISLAKNPINTKILLNNIFLSIQSKINQADLSKYQIPRYVNRIIELIDAPEQAVKDVEDLITCCIILAKHGTQNKSIINWFCQTNTTSEIDELIDGQYQSNINNVTDQDKAYLDRTLKDMDIFCSSYIFNNFCIEDTQNHILSYCEEEDLKNIKLLSRSGYVGVERHKNTQILIDSNKLDDKNIINMLKMLELRSLKLKIIPDMISTTVGIGINIEELKRLVTILNNNNNIKTIQLDISGNNLSGNRAKVIAQLFKLTHLNISNTNIGPEEAEVITNNLTDLVELDISKNNIGFNGALYIATKQTKLNYLNISNNDIGDAGAIAISTLPNLTKLTCLNNGLGNVGKSSVGMKLSSSHIEIKLS